MVVWLEGPFKTHVTIKTFLRNLSGLKWIYASLDFFRPKEQALNLRVSTVLFSAMLWLQNSSEKDFGTCLF